MIDRGNRYDVTCLIQSSDHRTCRPVLPMTYHVRIFLHSYGENSLWFQDTILSGNVLDIRREWGLHNLWCSAHKPVCRIDEVYSIKPLI